LTEGITPWRWPADDDANPNAAPQTAAEPVSRPVKTTVNARMIETLQKRPEANGWSAQQWAVHLGCAKSTVAGTSTWDALKVTKASAKIERLKARQRKPK
jgi:hypothetical protein